MLFVVIGVFFFFFFFLFFPPPYNDVTCVPAPHSFVAQEGHGRLQGKDVSLVVSEGHRHSHLDARSAFYGAQPFSLAYGGGGGGFGGFGGVGPDAHDDEEDDQEDQEGGDGEHSPTGAYTARGRPYGDAVMSRFLLGGSGGQLGYSRPADIFAMSEPQGRGGAGGGAIEVSPLCW